MELLGGSHYIQNKALERMKCKGEILQSILIVKLAIIPVSCRIWDPRCLALASVVNNLQVTSKTKKILMIGYAVSVRKALHPCC
jgi:hypothetical protein